MKIASNIRFYVYINDHETRNSWRDGKMVGKSFNYLSFLLFVGFYTRTHSTWAPIVVYVNHKEHKTTIRTHNR